jgi:hypothetical protein
LVAVNVVEKRLLFTRMDSRDTREGQARENSSSWMIRIGCRICLVGANGVTDTGALEVARMRACAICHNWQVACGEWLNGENEDDEVRTTASTRTRLCLVVSLHRIPFYRNPSSVI